MQEFITTCKKRLITEERFAYLRKYNLDSEYNKNKDKIKNSPRFPKGMIPDIVLHTRGDTTNNLLVVEFKPRKGKNEKYISTGQPRDIVKLEDFTNYEIHNYFLGVFVKLHKKKAKYKLFQFSQEIA